MEKEGDKLPPVGRFNYGQELFFWGIFYGVILLLLSGIALWYTEALPWSLRFVRYAAILIHASVALITIGLFLIHVYMSAILEEGSFGSMIHATSHEHGHGRSTARGTTTLPASHEPTDDRCDVGSPYPSPPHTPLNLP